MKTKNDFTADQNSEIYLAVKAIMDFLPKKVQTIKGGKATNDLLKEGSLIYSWVEQHRWDELFSCEDWALCVEQANWENRRTAGYPISHHLRTLAICFPQETWFYIHPELLPSGKYQFKSRFIRHFFILKFAFVHGFLEIAVEKMALIAYTFSKGIFYCPKKSDAK